MSTEDPPSRHCAFLVAQLGHTWATGRSSAQVGGRSGHRTAGTEQAKREVKARGAQAETPAGAEGAS